MPDCLPVRNLLTHIIGGGWGSESADDVNEQQVAVIRGADFPQIQVGDATSMPIRFESNKRVGTRKLQDGDIVLEISGGTNERPTGRSVFVSNTLLAKVPVPVIPASFCRLLRPDPSLVEPRYLYYWLQDMFEQGRTWAYQVRSTGIANFQTEYFLDQELVLLPPLHEQRRIAGVLGALDDLIEVNRGLAQDCDRLAQSLASSAAVETTLSSFTSWGGLSTVQPAGLVDHYSLPAFDNGRKPERVNGTAIKSNKQQISRSCVLVARLNPHIPRVWMVYPDPSVSSLASTEFVSISGDGVAQEVVYAICSAPAFLEQMNSLVTGTTGSHQRVDKDALTSVGVPDVRTLRAETLESITLLVQQAHSSRVEIQELTKTRDELLPLLMSGRIRVGEDVAA